MPGGRKLRLSIVGIQYPPSDGVGYYSPEEWERSAVTTKTEVEAEYYRKGDCHYFLYDEQMDGERVSVKTCIKCREGLLEMTRRGGMASRMVFQPGIPYKAEYPTPYGKLWFDITTHSVVLDTENDCPKVIVDYVLENEGRQMGIYRLEIRG